MIQNGFLSCYMISLTSARFAHNQKMLENMQHETAVILEQAFAQRGISKVAELIVVTVLINA